MLTENVILAQCPQVSFHHSQRVVGKQLLPPIYDLFAVVNHYGSLVDGHSTTFAKFDGDWHIFNDSSTETVNFGAVKSSGAVLLFYKCRNFKAPTF